LPIRLKVLDASGVGLNDKVTVHAPSVGLGNRALKVAAKKWSWSQSGEDWTLECPYPAETAAKLLLELRKKLNALNTDPSANARWVEDNSIVYEVWPPV